MCLKGFLSLCKVPLKEDTNKFTFFRNYIVIFLYNELDIPLAIDLLDREYLEYNLFIKGTEFSKKIMDT